jgi:uncharacterized protein YnzC (UPF0291/DUF896 family)
MPNLYLLVSRWSSLTKNEQGTRNLYRNNSDCIDDRAYKLFDLDDKLVSVELLDTEGDEVILHKISRFQNK